MFKSQDELKAFILWAKEQKLKRIRISDVEVEISDVALIESLSVDQISQVSPSTTFDETVSKEDQQKEDDELLFWSTQK
jgi:hypothetical protein